MGADTNLFKCYARDYATMPLMVRGNGPFCSVLGENYAQAHRKFAAAQVPPSDQPAHFVVHIKGEFTEYPCPGNIDRIVNEIGDVFRASGFVTVPHGDVCWRAKQNDNWTKDHVSFEQQEYYEDVMPNKAHQVVGGEALIAFAIPAQERGKLPIVEKAIDALIAQRQAERQAQYGSVRVQ